MARDVYNKRSKSAKRISRAIVTASPCRISGAELFSRMSIEALQAIDETRQEMREKLKKENEPEIAKPSAKDSDIKNLEEPVKNKSEEDNDSAIGTCSTASHPLGNEDENNAAAIAQTTAAQCHPAPARPATVCAHRPLTERDLKQKHKLLHPGINSSPWIRECIGRHTPATVPMISHPKKLNVFERLSAPAQISYRISARQRSRARLSLSLSLNNDRTFSAPFSQRKPDFGREFTRASIQSVSRIPSRRENAKSGLIRPKTRIGTAVEGNRPSISDANLPKNRVPSVSDANLPKNRVPSVASSSAKVETQKSTPVPELYDIENKSIDTEKSLGGSELQRLRPFEITPIGYDSRYAALQYDSHSPYPDNMEDCDIIRQSKMKCRQWLAHQMEILTS